VLAQRQRDVLRERHRVDKVELWNTIPIRLRSGASWRSGSDRRAAVEPDLAGIDP